MCVYHSRITRAEYPSKTISTFTNSNVLPCPLLPAQVFGFSKKGRMRTECDADLVIFDPETVGDAADFPGLGKPDAPNTGIRFVLVGGEIAVTENRSTGILAGRPLRSGV